MLNFNATTFLLSFFKSTVTKISDFSLISLMALFIMARFIILNSCKLFSFSIPTSFIKSSVLIQGVSPFPCFLMK
ncbi:MAG: hypothetical protein BWX92_02301 [Deltaproteobacteria bacterium ADurb.Bin135]|nr:MAG: hypothetical protein BWX92_02301 [Deltaproteobacteria bacterium ADurb.Bin135]